MPRYAYKVVDKDGVTREGELAADNEDQMLKRLQEQDYTVIDVHEISDGKPAGDVLATDSGINLEVGVSQKALAFFTRQFSITLNAGLPLTRIINTLYNQSSSKNLKKVIQQISRDIQVGQSVSAALEKHKNIFDGMFLSMVKVGETSGTLPQAMAKLADLIENEQRIKNKVKKALTYPLFVVVFASLVSYALIAILMPGFIPMFTGAGINIEQDYPITNFLVILSKFATDTKVMLISAIVLFLLIVAINMFRRTEQGKYLIDVAKFNIPILGGIVKKSAVARFCRSFATLMSSGIPLLKTMDLVSGASGSMVVSKAVEKMGREIQEGERVSKVLARAGVFPDLMVQMVSVGEEAGSIPEMMERSADYFDDELESSIETMTSMIEPVMMIVVGLIVGVFVMGIILPILGMTSRFTGS